MIISIINKKGGVGKTPFAFSIAKDFDYFLQSNDISIIENIYPDKAKISDTPKLIDNCVYDFGGFVAKGVLEIAEKSNYIIVPCVSSYNSILRTIETVNELKEYNKNIIILITNYKDEKEKAQMVEVLESNFSDLKFFYFKFSKIIENCMTTGVSFLELANENTLAKLSYSNFINEYKKLLDTIKE
ncbi:hypothetical protein JJB27_09170 [Campylobacter fetus subsp. venerealis]|uniref:Cpp12 n=1 Tax=Campylobacter hyointestinalis subsp. hyointestinalis TaxID=91352 RepID=A0A9W5EZN7_CAMHY|nr:MULTISPECIES: hypothetical protein [Campylobacter]MBC3780235.1 hypothetical protein [Campylobacter fetus subsp. fetus]MBC3781948.1 hypothetical protein [Campylobacter fetus subsp. venerealis]MBK3499235.1 hypothetical protein [Campylobacter fetus subsp. venerealis]MBK3501178.1 hypothetical protein [Campylobacter fetus subsp. venerealis]MBK3503175.1 hypothetical protein [Campylobacter fetus subsp. venerealis]